MRWWLRWLLLVLLDAIFGPKPPKPPDGSIAPVNVTSMH